MKLTEDNEITWRNRPFKLAGMKFWFAWFRFKHWLNGMDWHNPPPSIKWTGSEDEKP